MSNAVDEFRRSFGLIRIEQELAQRQRRQQETRLVGPELLEFVNRSLPIAGDGCGEPLIVTQLVVTLDNFRNREAEFPDSPEIVKLKRHVNGVLQFPPLPRCQLAKTEPAYDHQEKDQSRHQAKAVDFVWFPRFHRTIQHENQNHNQDDQRQCDRRSQSKQCQKSPLIARSLACCLHLFLNRHSDQYGRQQRDDP